MIVYVKLPYKTMVKILPVPGYVQNNVELWEICNKPLNIKTMFTYKSLFYFN